MNKRDFPKIHFYDQDFVDIYDKTWNWISDFWTDPKSGENSIDGYFCLIQSYVFWYILLIGNLSSFVMINICSGTDIFDGINKRIKSINSVLIILSFLSIKLSINIIELHGCIMCSL